MSDILERLREWTDSDEVIVGNISALFQIKQAAAEIERLRAALHKAAGSLSVLADLYEGEDLKGIGAKCREDAAEVWRVLEGKET